MTSARGGRRAWLVGAVAAAAGAAGLAAAWRGMRPAAGDPPPAGLWQLRFARPQGGDELALAGFLGKPLVLNFWATWCPPCVKELPELDRFHREHAARGWQVVGLAIDAPTPVREFLARSPLGFAVGLAGFDGTDLTRQLGNDDGALPFTAIFDAAGRVRHRKRGATSYAELKGWADDV